ncbi:MAG TPA: hypothetical protein PKV55_07300 [Nitrospira sp.]|nr:hypothetical protein [Nitrospira sp.]HNI67826.1 hypothetical protein [Nitrospira sp.]HNO34047.1 hypothetical protein [Nitrospira sp.]
MDFYLILAAATACIAGLAMLLYQRSGSLSFPLGVLFLYFWSIHGGWSIVADGLGADSQMQHHYLYRKVFPVELNGAYEETLLYYALFVIVIELTALACIVEVRSRRDPSVSALWISHVSLLVISALAGVASFLIVKDQLATAMWLGKSGYAATRGGLGEMAPLFTLHQVLNRVALFSLALGGAVWFTGREGRWLAGEPTIAVGIGYALLLAAVFGYVTVLGNKNELFSGLILGGLFYLANARRMRWSLVAGGAGGMFLCIALVDFLRAFPILDLWEGIDWWEAAQWVPEIRASNEAFGAHLSLYGVLYFHAPLTYGSSLTSLLASVVPRIFWPERPGDIYSHYAASVGIVEGIGEQGFSIHHATGWYLNFGLPGLVLGGIVWGWIWSRCFNAYQAADANRDRGPRWQYVLAVLAPWAFVAYIPPLIRAGLEGYKGLLIDALLVPTLVITVASYAAGLRTRMTARVPRPVEVLPVRTE